MPASTITRPTVTDDSGDGISGTILNAAFFTSIFDAIDALFSATTGITLNQAGGDGLILTLQSSDVAHGMTGVRTTDTYGDLSKIVASTGGLQVSGFSSGSVGLRIFGGHTTDDTAKSTAAIGVIDIYGSLKSGTSVGTLGANANLVVFRNNGTTKFIFDGDGDSHQDIGTAWTNFDDHPDVELLHALSAGVSRKGDPLRREFGRLLAKHRPALERAGIVTFNRDGHHFINWSRTHMLVIGAVRQQAAALAKTQRQVRGLQKRLKAA